MAYLVIIFVILFMGLQIQYVKQYRLNVFLGKRRIRFRASMALWCMMAMALGIFGGIRLGVGADAFDAVAKENERLYIYGDGESDVKKYLEKLPCSSEHVKYMGTISNTEVMWMEKTAELLINPRPNIGDYTKYSFPSKLIEYMNSGTPALVNKLDGVPEEYYDKLLLFNGNSVEDYKHSIRKALDLSDEERNRIGKDANEFIVDRNGKQRALRKIEKLFEAVCG